MEELQSRTLFPLCCPRTRAAVRALAEAARAERAAKFERLTEQLALRAQTEEEVPYPAAVLVGELIRARMAAR
jgi:hypothetical protein